MLKVLISEVGDDGLKESLEECKEEFEKLLNLYLNDEDFDSKT